MFKCEKYRLDNLSLPASIIFFSYFINQFSSFHLLPSRRFHKILDTLEKCEQKIEDLTRNSVAVNHNNNNNNHHNGFNQHPDNSFNSSVDSSSLNGGFVHDDDDNSLLDSAGGGGGVSRFNDSYNRGSYNGSHNAKNDSLTRGEGE